MSERRERGESEGERENKKGGGERHNREIERKRERA